MGFLTDRHSSGWDFFFKLSTRGRIITVALLAGPFVVMAIMAARHKGKFEDSMRAEMLAQCEAEETECQAWLEANHEVCFDDHYSSSGRTQTTTVDQHGYNYCVENGLEAAREKRREERDRRYR